MLSRNYSFILKNLNHLFQQLSTANADPKEWPATSQMWNWWRKGCCCDCWGCDKGCFYLEEFRGVTCTKFPVPSDYRCVSKNVVVFCHSIALMQVM